MCVCVFIRIQDYILNCTKLFMDVHVIAVMSFFFARDDASFERIDVRWRRSSFISEVNQTHEITVVKVLNVKLIRRWNLQHQRRLPCLVASHHVCSEELNAPAALALCRVLLMTWLHKGAVCFNYGRVLGSWLLLSFPFL